MEPKGQHKLCTRNETHLRKGRKHPGSNNGIDANVALVTSGAHKCWTKDLDVILHPLISVFVVRRGRCKSLQRFCAFCNRSTCVGTKGVCWEIPNCLWWFIILQQRAWKAISVLQVCVWATTAVHQPRSGCVIPWSGMLWFALAGGASRNALDTSVGEFRRQKSGQQPGRSWCPLSTWSENRRTANCSLSRGKPFRVSQVTEITDVDGLPRKATV